MNMGFCLFNFERTNKDHSYDAHLEPFIHTRLQPLKLDSGINLLSKCSNAKAKLWRSSEWAKPVLCYGEFLFTHLYITTYIYIYNIFAYIYLTVQHHRMDR